jgi:hypothetical protein
MTAMVTIEAAQLCLEHVEASHVRTTLSGWSAPASTSGSGPAFATATEVSTAGGAATSAVSCTSTTDCAAVGQPILETESSGSWGPATYVTTPGGVVGNLAMTAMAQD